MSAPRSRERGYSFEQQGFANQQAWKQTLQIGGLQLGDVRIPTLIMPHATGNDLPTESVAAQFSSRHTDLDGGRRDTHIAPPNMTGRYYEMFPGKFLAEHEDGWLLEGVRIIETDPNEDTSIESTWSKINGDHHLSITTRTSSDDSTIMVGTYTYKRAVGQFGSPTVEHVRISFVSAKWFSWDRNASLDGYYTHITVDTQPGAMLDESTSSRRGVVIHPTGAIYDLSSSELLERVMGRGADTADKESSLDPQYRRFIGWHEPEMLAISDESLKTLLANVMSEEPKHPLEVIRKSRGQGNGETVLRG